MLWPEKNGGVILILTFAALLVAASVRDSLVSLATAGVFLLMALAILYRDMSLLSEDDCSKADIRVLRGTTVFSGALLVALIILAVLMQTGTVTFTERQEMYLGAGIVACAFVFFGVVSPRLPFPASHRTAPSLDSAGQRYMEARPQSSGRDICADDAAVSGRCIAVWEYREHRSNIGGGYAAVYRDTRFDIPRQVYQEIPKRPKVIRAAT